MPVGYGSAFVPTQERKVTNLNPSGSGSLQEALTTPAGGSGVIVTMEGLDGSINRIGQSDIIVDQSRITIAGDNANVTLIGGGLRIKANDIEIRNLRILPGDEEGTPSKDNRDCIGIEGNAVPQRVWIHHNTLGWSTDGLLDIWPGSDGISPKQITIEDNIFAEALSQAGHSDGEHSTAVLLGKGSVDVFLNRNLFSGVTRRCPAFHAGCNVAVVNNLYYNTEKTIECYNATAGFSGALVDVIGNHMILGPESPWWRVAPSFEIAQSGRDPTTKVYMSDNMTTYDPSLAAAQPNYANMNAFPTNSVYGAALIAGTPQTVLPVTPMAASAVKVYVAANAGPANRTVFENRIIAEVLNGTTGSIKNTGLTSEKEYFGFPTILLLSLRMKGSV